MDTKSAVHPGSVVLVSGGGRGITARCVIELARYAHCKFILLGRSPISENGPTWASQGLGEAEMKQRIFTLLQTQGHKVTPAAVQKTYRNLAAQQEIRQTLAAVQEAGGQAEYLSVDIADNQILHQKVAETVRRFGPITGVIHGAGALADKLIEKKSELDFATVVSPKVEGLENLLDCVTPGRLEFLVLFSSIAGVFGNVGQADYALANEVLNKSAYLLQNEHPGCRVVAFDWGPWDGGMVTPELKRAFIQHQVQIIPAESGARMLVNELAAANSGSVQIVVGTRPVLPPPEPGVELRSYHIRRKLLLEDNPFLFDHVIGAHPVLPATCAGLWIGTACEQLYPGYTFYSLEKFRVLKGIVFDQTLSGEYMLDLQEVAKNGEIVFDATLWSQPKGKRLYHYKVRVALVRDVPPVPQLDPLNVVYDQITQPIPGDSLYKDGTLFHGPSFQGVERVLSLADGKLTMQCRLAPVDEARQGQFPVQTLNPYINDTIVQCLLIWAQRMYQAPCLPSYLERYEQYRPIPFGERFYVTMEVQSESETSVVGNILVQDALGQVYVRITGLEGTISRQLKRLF